MSFHREQNADGRRYWSLLCAKLERCSMGAMDASSPATPPATKVQPADAVDGGPVHDELERLVLNRRSLLMVGGAVAVQAAIGLAAQSQAAAATTGSLGQVDLPRDWFNDAEVQLKWTVGGPHSHPTGTVAGEPFEVGLVPSMTAQGLKVYTFKGKFGAAASQCTVNFGRDGDSFRANGSVGTSSIVITCAPQPPGTKKWPVGGTIDGQALALTVDLTEKDPLLAGTLGAPPFSSGSRTTARRCR